MRINEVERRVGVTKKNIRFYEEEGLLKPSRNAENGYREYTEADVAALQRIKLLRQLSVPLEEIRHLQAGTLTLEDCMQRQVRQLEQQAQNLLQIREVCGEIAGSHTGLADMDAAAWEQRIGELERAGTQFMNVNNDHRKKLVGPVVITVVLCALMLGAELALFRALVLRTLTLAWAAVLLALPAAVMGGLIAALWMRVREIRKGEEDEAAQY